MMRQYQRSKELPERDVTWDEFLIAAGAVGMRDPEFHARIAATMGSLVVVGNEKLRIVGEIPAKPEK
jgi:hypothetical protein